MASALSEIADIRYKSSRNADKALCGWYAMQTPGAGMKCCCVPEVRYFGYG